MRYQVCRSCPRTTPDAADPITGLCPAHQQIDALTAQHADLARRLAAAEQQRAGYAVLVGKYRREVEAYLISSSPGGQDVSRNLIARDSKNRLLSMLSADHVARAQEIGAAIEKIVTATERYLGHSNPEPRQDVIADWMDGVDAYRRTALAEPGGEDEQ